VNDKDDILHVIRFDGCVVKGNKAVDWIIRKPGYFDALIEIKGSDVEHALDQIHTSLCILSGTSDLEKNRVGVIFCRQYPSGSTTINRRRERILKDFGAAVLIKSSSKVVMSSEFNF